MSSFFKVNKEIVDENGKTITDYKDEAIQSAEEAEIYAEGAEIINQSNKDIQLEINESLNNAINSKNEVINYVVSSINDQNSAILSYSNSEDYVRLASNAVDDAEEFSDNLINISAYNYEVESGLSAYAEYVPSIGDLNLGIPNGKDGKDVIILSDESDEETNQEETIEDPVEDPQNPYSPYSINSFDFNILMAEPAKIEIGEALEFKGNHDIFPYEGEYIDCTDGATLTREFYPELLEKSVYTAEKIPTTKALASVSKLPDLTRTSFPENIGRNGQSFYLRPTDTLNTIETMHIESQIDSTTSDKIWNPFVGGYFYITPNSTEGSAGSVSAAYYNKWFSSFPINNVTLYDGTVCSKALICIIGSKRYTTDEWAIQVINLDDYEDDLSDWTNFTDTESRISQANSYSDGGAVRILLDNVVFDDDFFYVWALGDGNMYKFSYDFSGGTTKLIDTNDRYNSEINLTNDKYRATSISRNNNIFQLDIETLELYMNNEKVFDLYLNGETYTLPIKDNFSFKDALIPSDNISFGGGRLSFLVHEYNNQIFVYSIFGVVGACAYYDGSEWKNVNIPYPEGYDIEDDLYACMALVKLDLSNGLIIASCNYRYSRSPSSSMEGNDMIRYVISTDYGETWFQDDQILNSVDLISENISDYRAMIPAASFSGTTYLPEMKMLSQQKILREGVETFKVSSATEVKEYTYVPYEQGDTLIINPIKVENEETKTYMRVK